jgi:phosphatidylinositol N-acetylglucosaminyltransferase subunit A
VEVLVRGHIFLNCSLTESFCIALLEAASCGLFVVSTKVGGVQEVLPNSMINFAEPTIPHLVSALAEAISQSKRVVPADMHHRVVDMYNWMTVCERTEVVYDSMSKGNLPTLGTRFLRYLTLGPCSGVVACFIAALLIFLKRFWELIHPSHLIELCPDFSPPKSRPNAEA